MKVTVVSPGGKRDGQSLVIVIASGGSILSVAETPAKKVWIRSSSIGTPSGSIASIEVSPGQVISGGVVSGSNQPSCSVQGELSVISIPEGVE